MKTLIIITFLAAVSSGVLAILCTVIGSCTNNRKVTSFLGKCIVFWSIVCGVSFMLFAILFDKIKINIF